eukprot:403630_1
MANFKELTDFVKEAAKTIFNSEIANIIYDTIQAENYDDADDILDDLTDGHNSIIISSVSKKIKNKSKWNYDSKDTLYTMLILIYERNISDINALNKELEKQVDKFTMNVVSIVENLNKNIRKKIDIKSVKKLFRNNPDITQLSICTMKSEIFSAKAEECGIKSFQSKKMLQKIQLAYKNEQRPSLNKFPLHRESWTTGAKCEIYSESKRQWYDCVILDIYTDKDGEWLKVGYNAGNDRRMKAIGRYDKYIRPMQFKSQSPPSPHRTQSVSLDENMEDIKEETDEFPSLSMTDSYSMPSPSNNINNINNIRIKPRIPGLKKQVTLPLNPIHEREPKTNKQLWTPRKSKKKHRATFSLINLPQSAINTINETSESLNFIRQTSILSQLNDNYDMEYEDDIEWKEGDHCEMLIKSENKWVDAKVMKVFEFENRPHLKLRSSNSNIELEIPADDRSVRIAGRHDRSSSIISTLQNEFEQTERNTLLEKLDQVIEVINHEIDSSHNFLYQVYHIEINENSLSDIKTFITYEHDKAMEHYTDTIEQMNSTSMLCNGRVLKEYGKSNYYTHTTAKAIVDYETIELALHSEKLNKDEIINTWREHSEKYNQKWLLSVKKEDFVADFVETFKNDVVQNAMKLYDKLIATLKFGDTELKKKGKKHCHDEMFLWTKKDMDEKQQVKALDNIHFLYIVSLILDDHEIKIEFPQVETKQILLCLHKIGMNGLLFSKIEKNAFTGSVIIYSHSFKQVKIEALKQLVECTDELYDKLNTFDLESIQPSSICSISLSNSETWHMQLHDDDHKDKQDDEKKPTVEPLDIFTQWMITFDAQYNRATPFNLKMFRPLTAKYRQDKKPIIKMKYDNYSTDLHEKTYDDVLKSFIAWSITLKCSNLRCEETLKLCCYCDINTFQLFTYNIIMGIIELKANNDYSLLNTLSNVSLSVPKIVNAFCDILSDDLKRQKYFKEYKLFIAEWINFEFYNFRCEYCGHINKTIMIDRVYQYSKTMDSCRICNKRQLSR